MNKSTKGEKMSTLRSLQKANVSLVGKVVERSSHGYFGPGSYYAYVIVEENQIKLLLSVLHPPMRRW